MAALRRLIHSLANSSRKGTWKQPTPSKALKVIAAGACVTAAAGAAYYGCSSVGRRSGLKSHVEARLFHLALPSVSATEKVRTFGLDDGDVYMSSYENRFRLFSSVECEGQLYMTPLNFIESITLNEPKSKRAWKSLTKKELDKMLADTPPVWKGSSNLFRNLRERGAISYTEYLFLLCILTKPHAGFRIAFNMFDADGNEMVDKREFLVLEEIFRKKKDKKEVGEDVQRFDQQSLQLYGHHKSQPHSHVDEKTETTLLVHFFGKKGKAELKFEDFYKFMDNLQTEVLEIEFLSYSKGCPPSARKTSLGSSFATPTWMTSAGIWKTCATASQMKRESPSRSSGPSSSSSTTWRILPSPCKCTTSPTAPLVKRSLPALSTWLQTSS
ncbi:Calcium uptake protein 3, mitochondrial EF-hand domain-containing family member A2 [Larimichthys crocea]|uniref:Calcium uptake protein 3, mitochondrial EF-hand domain-containing family member A2 n=1 Tax=Larimichthys crocea TaxID=215358 RepID=A0A6G0I4L9_LARCR|nr:Calcium uptake protein 3, mitochondrial EF-hand domain-containing family member A2 [Larimichthys crocea]